MPTAAFVMTRKAVALLIVYLDLIACAMFSPATKMGQVSWRWGR